MDLEDRIRTRAYFHWLNRPQSDVSSELDDWLASELEELALDLVGAASQMALPVTSFTQDDLWYGSERIAKLFGLMKPRLMRQRAQSRLLSMINSCQDYMTSSAPVDDPEAERQGRNILHIFRLLGSLGDLIGKDFNASTHSIVKEFKDLFGNDLIAFDTAEFNVYSAATIQSRAQLPVFFINEGDETTPDLRVDDIAYVECKDIHTLNRNNIRDTLEENLTKAHGQLAAAQRRDRLPGTGVCIDVPWGTLPLIDSEWDVIRQALTVSDGPQFVLISSSGIELTKDAIGFPVALCLVWSSSGQPIFDRLLRKLTPNVSYKMQPDGFDEIKH